jgi:hypothetical protein
LRDGFDENYMLFLDDKKQAYLDMMVSYKDRILKFYECMGDIVYYTDIKMKGLYQYTKATINYVYDVLDNLYN